MSEVVKKPLKITETVLRDAHQSLIATRMTTEQMLPIVDKMDKVGYNAVECWGGATFDACLRFLKEDPWDRLRKLRDGFKNTKLQMLFRGQNILGYRPYADDVVEYFVQKSIANGIDIIRIFDCLNDIRNLQTAVTACNKEKGHAQVALSYTLGDAYTLDYWMDMAKRVEDMGADSLCIKDMAGLLVPAKATELVQALKDSTSLPVELHTHYTSGVASMTYMKAVEAGVDIIDTAMSPFALGTSQPATEVMVEAFKGTEFDTGLDLNLLSEIADYFRPMREESLASGLMNPKVLGVNINTLRYQVPGGMLSNLISQLKEQGKEDKYEEVLAEVPRVRKDLGEPPLVTPSSHRLYLTYSWARDTRLLLRRLRISFLVSMVRQLSLSTQRLLTRFLAMIRRMPSHVVRQIFLSLSLTRLSLRTFCPTHCSRRLLLISSSTDRHSRQVLMQRPLILRIRLILYSI